MGPPIVGGFQTRL